MSRFQIFRLWLHFLIRRYNAQVKGLSEDLNKFSMYRDIYTS